MGTKDKARITPGETENVKEARLGALRPDECVDFKKLMEKTARRIDTVFAGVHRLELLDNRNQHKCELCARYPKQLLMAVTGESKVIYICADFNDCDKYRSEMDAKGARRVLKYMKEHGQLDG